MNRLGIFDTLRQESRAELQGFRSFGEELSFAGWRNDRDRVTYAGAGHHTFSIYRSGYGNALRTDKNLRGVEGSFCLMPAGAGSQWRLRGPVSFIHLYFDDQSLDRIAERVFDKGPAAWSVPDITYGRDPSLTLLCQWLLRTPFGQISENSLLAEQNITTVMTYLIGSLLRRKSLPSVTGGLSPRNRRITAAYIDAHCSRRLLLKELAEQVGLSEFHFQRMFRQSFGAPPHEYINRVRIDRAKRSILRGDPLVQAALDAGFSSQPHFSRVFKKQTGLSPGQFRSEKGAPAARRGLEKSEKSRTIHP